MVSESARRALSGPKKSAKGKYTAVPSKGGLTETDKRVASIQKREAESKTSLKRESSPVRTEPEQPQSKRKLFGGEYEERANMQESLGQAERARAAQEEQRANNERHKLDKPGGWRNVVDVLKIAVNPFSKEKIVSEDEGVVGTATEAVANNPYTSAFMVTGVAGLVRGAASGIAAATTKTAVTEAAKIGTTGVIETTGKNAVKGVAQTMATNTATQKATASMLTKIVGAVKDPQFVVGALMATVGSYPFAGFIKEEALQTVGFGVNTAINNGDMDGADRAMELQEQILDPGVWDQIKAKVPFVNVLNSLNDFYKAARLKLDIDKKVISDLKIKVENGETDAEMYARIAEERRVLKEQDRLADAEYYKNIEERQKAAKIASRKEDAEYYKGLSDAAAAAAKKKRADDEAYWAKVLADRPTEEAKKTRLDDDYWTEYYKTLDKLKSNSMPSKLSFGLL